MALGLVLLASGSVLAQGIVLPLPAEDQQNIVAHLGSGVVGSALPSLPISEPSVYFPLRERTQKFQVVVGRHPGNIQNLELVNTLRPDGEPAWRFDLSPKLDGFMRENPRGDISMAALIDSGEGVFIVTKPANPFIPKGMEPGETRSYAQHVSVNYLDDPRNERFSGSLSGTYTYLGAYQVTVPAGKFPAVLFRVKCEGRVGPAHTQNTGYNFFAPRVGVIAMILEEDVTAFWLFNIDSTTGKVLISN
jgi:hypothetical protein